MAKNNHLKWGGGVIAVIASIVTILVSLGILPWVSQAEYKTFKEGVDTRVKRIEKQVDDIHQIFYPRRSGGENGR